MNTGLLSRLFGLAALAGAALAPTAAARADNFESSFDRTFGTELRTPRSLPTNLTTFSATPITRAPSSSFEAQIVQLANAAKGRIGVAAIDLSSGRTVAVLGDQPFPMASTSKVAIVATFLDGVDKGRFSLDDQYPIMLPLPSARLSGSKAPVRAGPSYSARYLIERTLINSDNHTTDALLAVVGGPAAVNRWMRGAGITGFRLDRDIATLVRDDGAVNPATTVDPRDSATPLAMAQFLAGLYQGRWLSSDSRQYLLSTMERCVTGRHRMRALLPEDARIAHKTGTLSNTSSDVGIIQTADGRTIVAAIYVTGQGGKPARDARIATIARAIYDGYQTESPGSLRNASR